LGENAGGDRSTGKAMKPSGRSAAALQPRIAIMGFVDVTKRGAKRATLWVGGVPYKLPLEPLTVRIPVAVQLTGIGRSKIYELIKAGKLDTVKVGASTLITVASLRRLVEKQKR
jgi:excisionase family DNA binding protein